VSWQYALFCRLGASEFIAGQKHGVPCASSTVASSGGLSRARCAKHLRIVRRSLDAALMLKFA